MDVASSNTKDDQFYVAASMIDNQSDRSHSDDDPIEASRDGGETRSLVDLNEVAKARKGIIDFNGNHGVERGCKTWQR